MRLSYSPKVDKIVELLLHLAHVRPGVDKYQVVKLFYLADKEHLNRYGRPITQEQYFALTYGPVASTAKDLVEMNGWIMSKAGLEGLPFEAWTEQKNGRDVTVIGKPKRDVNQDFFSKSDIKVFDEIVEKYGQCSFDELFEITHDHQAYRKAWARKKPTAHRSEMFYDEMIESEDLRDSLTKDLDGVSQFLE